MLCLLELALACSVVLTLWLQSATSASSTEILDTSTLLTVLCTWSAAWKTLIPVLDFNQISSSLRLLTLVNTWPIVSSETVGYTKAVFPSCLGLPPVTTTIAP